VRAASGPVTLLDGGTGTELRMRGVEVPSHKSSIWSAQALIDAPEAVVQVHRDYIDAGADVITLNNYAVTRPLLAREGLEDRLEELTLRAIELAERARTDPGRDVRLAGSLPPLDTSYRADLVGPQPQLLDEYRRMAELLAPRVDLLLCETLASAREAVAAATAALETEVEVWLSWTLQGNWPDHLPSGESLEEAFAAARELEVDACLVNCCGADLVTHAMPTLARLCNSRPGNMRFGGYGHPAEVEPAAEGELPAALDELRYRPLDGEGYADHVARWLDAGASVVGGCCRSRPAHVARLRRLIDERSG
jgi:S-methylmethionine-dependent homocysteine/selenocysteine methylase